MGKVDSTQPRSDISAINTDNLERCVHREVVCSKCHRAFISVLDLLGHRLQESANQEEISCDLCASEFANGASLQHHYDAVHGLQLPMAIDPPKEEVDSVDANVTLESVVGGKSVKHSNNGLLRMRRKRRRKMIKYGPGWDFCCRLIKKDCVDADSGVSYTVMTLKCLLCEFEAKTRTLLRRHVITVHDDRDVESEICDVTRWASDENVIRISEYSGFSQASKSTRLGRNIRRYVCSKCAWSFMHKNALIQHMSVHKTTKEFSCDVCNKAFKTEYNLSTHFRVHREKKAYSCRQCDFTSLMKTAIREHRQLHGEGGIVCDICGTVHACKSSLMKHMRVHDLNRPFECDFNGCMWRFNSEQACAAHFKGHGAVNTFFCAVCGCSFRHKHHLKRHEHRIHKLDRSKNPVVSSGNNDQSRPVVVRIDQSNPSVRNDQLVLQPDRGLTSGQDVGPLAYNVAVIPHSENPSALTNNDLHANIDKNIPPSQIIVKYESNSNINADILSILPNIPSDLNNDSQAETSDIATSSLFTPNGLNNITDAESQTIRDTESSNVIITDANDLVIYDNTLVTMPEENYVYSLVFVKDKVNIGT